MEMGGFWRPTMNGYRLIGDMSHVLAILLLLYKLLKTRSSAGVSGKTQLLFALTYTFRYIDVFWAWISYYNTMMKGFYIVISYMITYLTFSTYRETYDWDGDSFRVELLLFPVTVLAYLINYETTFHEIGWTWSIYMEAFALIPQFFMIWKRGKADWYMISYIFLIGLYRGMYLFNWAYRYINEGYFDVIAFTSGIIETFVAMFGFLCVISAHLAKCSDSAVFDASNRSVYIIPDLHRDDAKLLGNVESTKKKSHPLIHV